VPSFKFDASPAVQAVMRANKRRDTRPELRLRGELHRRGLRYRVDLPIRTSSLIVRPDIVFTRRRVAVFVDGCYWHACPDHGTQPTRNVAYWLFKLRRNVERDRAVDAALAAEGWRVVRLWEHEPADRAVERVCEVL
jgi:DNA mismatch endonuclease, patch repair protein